VAPADFEDVDDMITWLNKPVIKTAVYLLLSPWPGAADKIYLEISQRNILPNQDAPPLANIGMISGEDNPSIDRDISIILSEKIDLRVYLIGPVRVGDCLIGLCVPYKTIDRVTGKVEKSCYNIYAHFAMITEVHNPTPNPTPPEPNNPNYPTPNPTPPEPNNPNYPTPTPSTPTLTLYTPPLVFNEIKIQLSGGSYITVKEDHNYSQQVVFGFWYTHTWGEYDLHQGTPNPEPTGVPTYCPTLMPTGLPTPFEPTPEPTTFCPTVVPTNAPIPNY